MGAYLNYYISPSESKIQLFFNKSYKTISRLNFDDAYRSVYNPEEEGTYLSRSFKFSLLAFNEFMDLDFLNIDPNNISWEIVGPHILYYDENGQPFDTLGGFFVSRSYENPFEAFLDINNSYWYYASRNLPAGIEFGPNSFFIKVKYLNPETTSEETEVSSVPTIAYFPVEIISYYDKDDPWHNVNEDSDPSLGKYNAINSYIPVLQGGFDEVLYSKAGMSPKQDNDPFYLNALKLQNGMINYIDLEGKLYSKAAWLDKNRYDLKGGTNLIYNVNSNHSLNFYQDLSYKELKSKGTQFIGMVSGGLDNSNISNNIAEEDSFANGDYLSCAWNPQQNVQKENYLYTSPTVKESDYKNFKFDLGISEDNLTNFNNYLSQLEETQTTLQEIQSAYNELSDFLNNFKTAAGGFLSSFYLKKLDYYPFFEVKRKVIEKLQIIQSYLTSILNFCDLYATEDWVDSLRSAVNRQYDFWNELSFIISSYGFANLMPISEIINVYSDTIKDIDFDDSSWSTGATITGLVDTYNNLTNAFLEDLNTLAAYESKYTEFYDYLSGFANYFINENNTWPKYLDNYYNILQNFYNNNNYSKSYSEFLEEWVKPIIISYQKAGLYTYSGSVSEDLFWTKSGSGYFSNFVSDKLESLSWCLNQLDVTINTLSSFSPSSATFSLKMGPNNIIQVHNLMTYDKPIVNVNSFEEESELSFLWDWDGTTTKINDDSILTPLIGAGYKYTSGGQSYFNGMLMGKIERNSKTFTGLFGYNKNVQTMFLNARDGSAIFGKAGTNNEPGPGQIIIDPSSNKGLIYSSTYWSNYGVDGKPSSYSSANLAKAGMLIDLSTPEIRFGNGNFVVTSEGHVTAAGGGKIAGWNITDTIITSFNNGNGITIDSGRTMTGLDENGNKVYTNGQGKIYGGSHNILGSSENGFYLSSDGMSIGSKVYIDSNGVMRLGAGAVANSGNFWTIDGGNNSYISYGTVGSNGSVYIGTDAIKLGSQFSVDNNGYLEAKNIKATGGSIGGWNISDSCIWSTDGKVALYNDGRITGGSEGKTFTLSGNGLSFTGANGINIDANTGTFKGTGFELSNAGLAISAGTITLGSRFKVTSDGTLTANHAVLNSADVTGKITATSGKIGGWTIDGNSLQCSGAVINGDTGTIVAMWPEQGTGIDVGRTAGALAKWQSDLETVPVQTTSGNVCLVYAVPSNG